MKTDQEIIDELRVKNEEKMNYHIETEEKRIMADEVFAKKILELQNAGVHISIVRDIAKGSEEVTRSRREFNLAVARLKRCSGEIKVLRLSLSGGDE